MLPLSIVSAAPCQKGIKRGSVIPEIGSFLPRTAVIVKKVSNGGSTQEPPSRKATACQGNQFRFGYGKAANDPAVAGVPDPVGSVIILAVRVRPPSGFCQ